MEFLTAKQLDLNPAGYLVSKETKKPVTHSAFVKEQQMAHYMIKLAEATKGKVFKAGKLDNLDRIKAEVLAAINATTKKEYVATPTKPTSKVNDELVEYAMKFVEFESKKEGVDKINEFMSQFSTIDAVESVGDYFSEGIVKLSAIYTIADVLSAVQANIENLA